MQLKDECRYALLGAEEGECGEEGYEEIALKADDDLEKQDEHLSAIGKSANTIRKMGDRIVLDLESQNELLGDLDDIVAGNSGRINSISRRMARYQMLEEDSHRCKVITALSLLFFVCSFLILIT